MRVKSWHPSEHISPRPHSVSRVPSKDHSQGAADVWKNCNRLLVAHIAEGYRHRDHIISHRTCYPVRGSGAIIARCVVVDALDECVWRAWTRRYLRCAYDEVGFIVVITIIMDEIPLEY